MNQMVGGIASNASRVTFLHFKDFIHLFRLDDSFLGHRLAQSIKLTEIPSLVDARSPKTHVFNLKNGWFVVNLVKMSSSG